MTKYNPYKWHFITYRQVPKWVEKRFGHSASEMASKYHGDAIEETIKYARGRQYEYKWVVTVGEHTNDNAVIRRKLKHHKKDNTKQ